MDKKILRLLIVDDSPDDAETVLSAFRKAGYLLKSQRVADLGAFQHEIEKGEWDAVLAEYAIPHFGAGPALEQTKRAGLEIPFVVYTRQIADADLVKIMRAGAHDVVQKREPARLVPALERELRVADERARHRVATKSLEEVEHKHRAIIEGAREAVCYSQDGMHLDANKAYLALFGYESFADLEGIPVMNLIDKGDQARFKDHIRKNSQGGAAQEFVALRHNGDRFHAEMALSPITINGEACTQIVVTDISKRKAVETKLQYLNQHDALTGLYNRPYLLQELGRAVERSRQSGDTAGALYIDFHELKQISNLLGHAAGDRFLIKIVRLLRETLGESVLIARIGDHEFAGLMPQVTAPLLKTTVSGLEKKLAELCCTEGGQNVRCGCRVASALVERGVENAQKLMTDLYRSAGSGAETPAAIPPPGAERRAGEPEKKPLELAEKRPAAKSAAAPTEKPAAAKPAAVAGREAAKPAPVLAAAKASTDWEARIASALEKDAFHLAYQPIVSLHGDAAEYFEVLVRLQGSDEEAIVAGDFMPEAERTGQVAAIDRLVVRQAARALADLHRDGRAATLFVNLARTVFADPEMVPLLQGVLRETGLKAAHLVLEVDEDVLATNIGAAGNFVRAAKQAGCSVCVDNFGRSLAAFSQLRDLPIDYLKIDGALVRNARDQVGQAALKAVVEVAKSIEKKTIAKCVESAGILSALWNLGIDYAQGHYFEQGEATAEEETETTLSSETGVPSWATQKRR